MGIKRQNQGINSGQNCPKKIFSFQLIEGNPSISWKEQKFFWQFWPELIPWFWCLMHMTILRRLEIISCYQFVVILKFVKISCIFTKYAIKINWYLEKMSNLHRIVMDIKHQNQGVKLGQNHQIKFCSFQLMEGNPSISWQYFHRLEAFHLLAFGYNWYVSTSCLCWGWGFLEGDTTVVANCQ